MCALTGGSRHGVQRRGMGRTMIISKISSYKNRRLDESLRIMMNEGDEGDKGSGCSGEGGREKCLKLNRNKLQQNETTEMLFEKKR